MVTSVANMVRTTGSGSIAITADSFTAGAANAVHSATDLTVQPFTGGATWASAAAPAACSR